jgi:hypothetical protein
MLEVEPRLPDLISFGLFFSDGYHFVDLNLLAWDKPARWLASFRDAFLG